MAILTIKNLSKVYPNGVHALKNVSFEVPEGAFVAVIGLSGSGKSTLLRCINRLHEPSEGSIVFKGQEVTTLKGKALRSLRADIGMIFQHFNLVPRATVMGNVLTGKLGRSGIFQGLFAQYPESVKAEANKAIKIVGLDHRINQRADKLSGGQQQRVAIARALMQSPSLLLADEPVASLDPATSHSVMQYLENINKELGVTILCNLHFLSLVRQYATLVIALKGGEVVFQGNASEIDEAWFKQIYGEEAKEVTVN